MTPSNLIGKGTLAVPAGAAAAVVALALWPDAFGSLAWDRQAIGAGELWRALTGQFVHLGASHALLNLAGLGAIAVVFRGAFDAATWAGALGASLAGVAVGLQWFSPAVEWYAGLSGALHGLLAAGAVTWIRSRETAGWAVACLLAGKLAWEWGSGASAVSVWLTGGPVLVEAHLWGALGGLAWGLAWPGRRGGYNPPPRGGRPGGEEER